MKKTLRVISKKSEKGALSSQLRRLTIPNCTLRYESGKEYEREVQGVGVTLTKQ